jgi:hypothetical protein
MFWILLIGNCTIFILISLSMKYNNCTSNSFYLLTYGYVGRPPFSNFFNSLGWQHIPNIFSLREQVLFRSRSQVLTRLMIMCIFIVIFKINLRCIVRFVVRLKCYFCARKKRKQNVLIFLLYFTDALNIFYFLLHFFYS